MDDAVTPSRIEQAIEQITLTEENPGACAFLVARGYEPEIGWDRDMLRQILSALVEDTQQELLGRVDELQDGFVGCNPHTRQLRQELQEPQR